MEVIFEGYCFLVEHYQNYTEEQFIERGMLPGKQGLFYQYNDEKRLTLIRQAFKLLLSFGDTKRDGITAVPLQKSKNDAGRIGTFDRIKKSKRY